jgi:hypothetical protein
MRTSWRCTPSRSCGRREIDPQEIKEEVVSEKSLGTEAVSGVAARVNEFETIGHGI